MTRYDDPADLADLVAGRPRPLLIGLDVDGVLAPLVDHADDSALLPGIADAIADVGNLPDVHVAVVSGRSVDDLQRFGFADDIEVVGSHGMETRDRPMLPLTERERNLLALLDDAAVAAASQAGDGAWVERKPASVTLHVRQAGATAGHEALDRLAAEAATHPGASTKAGSDVLEAFARSADKGSAMTDLGRRLGAATTVFVGDDITDEEAFAALGSDDVSIKVGDADTLAPFRLRDPHGALQWLRSLASSDRGLSVDR